MSYRGDDEPEYIDDDEFFDPDDADRRSSNVLGGSGSRPARDATSEPPDEGSRQSTGGREASGNRADRPKAKQSAGRNSVKTRNPAPSVASSEERRARLAGKHPQTKSRPESRKSTSAPAKEADTGKARFAGLRARFSRGESKAEKKSGSSARGKPSRIGAGISRRLGGIKGRFGRKASHDDRADKRVKQAEGKRSGQSTVKDSGRHFGSSRGTTKPADARIGAAAQQQGSKSDSGRNRSSKTPRIASNDWLNLDRMLDLIGVGLVFGAIVFVFSALSPEQAAIGSVHTIVGQLLGWGAFAAPATMFAIGMWLIIRHFGDQAPIIDPLRISGLALAFLGALVLFQYLDSLSYAEFIGAFTQCSNSSSPACIEALVQQSYESGRGGGLVGGWLYSALVINLTELGGFVMVVMVLTFATMMITRSSMAEIAVVTISLSRSLRTRVGQYAVQRRAARLKAQQQMALAQEDSHVRVSKPQPAQLTGSPQAGRALPEPSAESMPIPVRLREWFGRRGKPEVELEAEAAALASPAPEAAREQTPGMVERFFRRGRNAPEPRPPSPGTADAVMRRSGSLERFLNLGDDLSPPSAAPTVTQWRASAPTPEQASPPKPQRYQAPAPIKPIESDPGVSQAPAPIADLPDLPSADIAAIADDPRTEIPEPPPAAPAPGTKPEWEAPIVDDSPEAVDELASEKAAEIAKDEAPDKAPTEAEYVRQAAEDEPAAAVPKSAPAALARANHEKPRPRIAWDAPDYRELLNSGAASDLDQEPLMQQAKIIEDTLASFGAPGRVVEINSGPVITQYGVEPDYMTAKTGKRSRVKVGAIAKLDKDLQLALGARSLRMEAPVPGKGYVGIEVPNPASARVGLRDVMDSESYQKIDSPLAIALGMSVDGKPIAADLTQMPHMLIAGTTGSGKSVCVNAIINSILVNNSPETVRFIMVDPKRVELTGYNGLPHLVAPVVVELERIIGVLRWVTTEMDGRYKKFSRAGARNIIDYNSILDPDLAAMPYIVVVIDELADLMMMAPDDTERAIARIAALARATGIHLIIATQRPSVDVVTGLIKANCPARIAFAVASSVDSRVIIDQPGAERLLGKGDMLYLSGDAPAPKRVQGVHVSNEEINRIGRFWKLQGAGIEGVKPIPLPPKSSPASAADSVADAPAPPQTGSQSTFWDMSPKRDMTGMAVEGKTGNPNPEEDELYQTAVDMVRRLEKASVSLLQRRLRIGYTRAARLVDMMEERGVVGPPKEGSSKPRDVLPQ